MSEPSHVSEFFDAEAAEWSERYTHDARFERRFEKITALLGRVLPEAPGRALDIGCGSGVFSRYLASKGWNVTAIDLSPEMIEEAKASSNNDGIAFAVFSFESFDSSPNSFDLVLSLSMLEYIEDDEAAIQKCSALLRTGGIIMVSVPNKAGLLRKIEGTIFGIRTATKGRIFRERGEYLLHQKQQYSPMELDIMMRQQGLRKKRGMFLNAAVTRPRWLLPLLERRWWAAMYCGVYEKK